MDNSMEWMGKFLCAFLFVVVVAVALPIRQTRCLLTSIATNHVATGLLVTVWNIYPSLIGCWPYGVLLCQIQVSCVIIHFAFLREIIPLLQPLDFHAHRECLGLFFFFFLSFLEGANVSPCICSISGNRGGGGQKNRDIKSPLTRDFGNSYRLTIPVPDNCPPFFTGSFKEDWATQKPTFSSGWSL
jgi:hypothetical protein